MAELFFILTTVFVAYVIFAVVDCEKRKKEEAKPKAAANPATSVTKPAPAVKTQPAPTPVKAKPVAASKAKPKPASKTSPAKSTKTTATPAKATSDSVKNPATGEVAKVASNYRFVKRWIKDALVSEGLLDKVYKNNELDDETLAKIDTALEQLKSMAKYQ
jgi:type IV secretory pathway VirB10-like protein